MGDVATLWSGAPRNPTKLPTVRATAPSGASIAEGSNLNADRDVLGLVGDSGRPELVLPLPIEGIGAGQTGGMAEIIETNLPGVGLRHELVCASGERVGVITHHSGRRDLLTFDLEDPDSVSRSVAMGPDEAQLLADLLGGSTLVERFEDLRQHIAGLSIDWLPVSEGSRFAGVALGATEMRTRTGVSAIAVLRHGTAIPAPGPDEVLFGGDTVVVVGLAEGIDAAAQLLREAER